MVYSSKDSKCKISLSLLFFTFVLMISFCHRWMHVVRVTQHIRDKTNLKHDVTKSLQLMEGASEWSFAYYFTTICDNPFITLRIFTVKNVCKISLHVHLVQNKHAIKLHLARNLHTSRGCVFAANFRRNRVNLYWSLIFHEGTRSDRKHFILRWYFGFAIEFIVSHNVILLR